MDALQVAFMLETVARLEAGDSALVAALQVCDCVKSLWPSYTGLLTRVADREPTT